MNENKLAEGGQENLAETSRLFERVREILDAARSNVARSVNTEMVRAYLQIGQAIVEDEQQGEERAGYGERIIQSLSARLKAEGLKGFGRRNLAWMREFYLKFQNLHALRAELSWTHYGLLLKVESDAAREFHETETIAGNWSTRELERQINSFFFGRTGTSIERRKMLEAGRASKDKYQPQDFVKDPLVLEFLNLKDAPHLTESDIEQVLLDHLPVFASNNLVRFRHEDNFRHHAFAFLRRREKDAARRRVNRKHFVALNFHLDAVPE